MEATLTLLLVTLFSNIYSNSGTTSGLDVFGNWAYAAIGSDNFDDGYGCGNCYTIKCTGAYTGDNNPNCECDTSKTLTIQAIDACDGGCDNNHFDLNKAAMTYFTGSSSMTELCGELAIEYQRVDCSSITSNFKIINKGGTTIGWYAFHLEDVNDDGGIASVELLKDGSTIATCDKSWGSSFWVCFNNNGGLPMSASTPLDIKITSDLGKSVTASDCISSFEPYKEMTCDTNLGGGSSSATTTTTTSSGGSSSSGKIQIKQNANVNEWWYAIEFPNGDSSSVSEIEFRDSNHDSWITGSKQDWEGTIAYSFSDGTKFSGSQHFRVTDSSGHTASSWNVFTGLSGGSTVYISLPGSSYTEEDGDNTSSFPITAIIAVILLVCILTGIGAYCLIKRRKQTSAVSFDTQEKENTESVPTSTGYDMDPIEVDAETNNETKR